MIAVRSSTVQPWKGRHWAPFFFGLSRSGLSYNMALNLFSVTSKLWLTYPPRR